MRQNVTYGSQGSVGASSTFSPPPYDSFYYTAGQSTPDFFGQPIPIQDNFFPQSNNCYSNGLGGGGGFSNGISNGLTNGFSNGLSNGFASAPASDSMSPYYTSVPNLGMGQAIQGPNGSIIFLPVGMGMPCQQMNWIVN